jgi:hypothetical protein
LAVTGAGVADDGLLADCGAGLTDSFEGFFHGVFHDGHAAADGCLDPLELLVEEDVHFAAGTLALFVGGAEDLFALDAGILNDAVLGDEGVGAVAGDLYNPDGFVLGFADDALALTDHALGLLDLVRYCHP